MHASTESRRRTILGSLTKWWRNWWEERARLVELAGCDEQELARIARDLGVTARDLEALASQDPDSANLLSRRMNGLNLNTLDVARSNGPVLRDLQRLCSICDRKRVCMRDLDRDPADYTWQSYCPNANTLKALTMESEIERALTRGERRWRRAASAP